MQQGAATGSTWRHKVKLKIDGFYEGRSAIRQRPAHGRKGRLTFLFRLLTGGLLVRIQAEEPIFTITYRHAPNSWYLSVPTFVPPSAIWIRL